MEAAAAEVPAVSAEPKAASTPLPSPHKQAAPPASQSQASQPSKQTSAAVKAQRTCCPACGAPPLTEEELQTVRKPGRRSTRDASDPRNRPENLVKTEFLQQHIVRGGMSLREISAYHGYTISTLSRRAKQLGVQVGRLPRAASDSEQASEGTAVRSPAPTPPRKRPPQDKQLGREEQQGSPSKRRRARPEQPQERPHGQPAKRGGAAAAAAQAAHKPAVAAAAPAASSVSTGATPAAAAPAPAPGNGAAGPGDGDDQTAAKRRRRPCQPAEKLKQASPAPQRPLVPMAIAPGVAAATAAAAAMRPLLALPLKPVEQQKPSLGAASAAAAPAQLVHLWHPPSKEQLEIWQAVQAQAAAAAAAKAQAQRPAAALPLWQPVVLPASPGLQHSPMKPPRPASSPPKRRASPMPARRRAAARAPQPQVNMLDDSDDEDAIAGLVSLRHQSTEPPARPSAAAAVTTAAGPAEAAVAAGPTASSDAAQEGAAPLPAANAVPAAAGTSPVLARGTAATSATQTEAPAEAGVMPALPTAEQGAPAVPAPADPLPAAEPTGSAEVAGVAAAAQPVAELLTAAIPAPQPTAGVAEGVQVKLEPLGFTTNEQQGAAGPPTAKAAGGEVKREPGTSAAAEQGHLQVQDKHERPSGQAGQQQPVSHWLPAEQQGAVEAKHEQPGPAGGHKDLEQPANGCRLAAVLPAALLQAEALAGCGSGVGSQHSEELEAQALLVLPGTQQSACCPVEEAAQLCMQPGHPQQRRQPPEDGHRQQLLPAAEAAAWPAQPQDARPFAHQPAGAASPEAAIEDATPAASTGGPAVFPELERVRAQAAQHLLQSLPVAFEKADTGCAASMLRPLRRLLLAGQGGRTLQDIVARWAGFSLLQQQEIFSTAVLAASATRWQDLEDQLKLALELID